MKDSVTLEEMINTLNKAIACLIPASLNDTQVMSAQAMITCVAIGLGDFAKKLED